MSVLESQARHQLELARSIGDRLLWLRLAIAVLVILAVIAGITFRDYGLGWDDYTHSQYGDLLLKLYGSGVKPTFSKERV